MPAKARKRKAKDEPEAPAAAAAAPANGDAATATTATATAATDAAAAPAADAKKTAAAKPEAKAKGGRKKKTKTEAATDAATAPESTAAAAPAADAKDEKDEKKPAAAAATAAAKEPEPVLPAKVAEYNEVLCFGSGDMSQLGLGAGVLERKNPAPLKSLEGYHVHAVASGALHNAVLLDGGQFWTWGCNDDHALGRTTDEWLPARVTGGGIDRVFITAIACGDCHTIALDDAGDVWSWGTYKDSKGVMGYDAKTEHQKLPTKVRGLNAPVVAIAAGEHHDLALTASGEVFEWGDTRVGARGSERVKRTKLTPQRVIFKDAKKKVLRKMTGVWACGMSNFVRGSDGRVYAWGLNNYGQCGVGNRTNVVTPTPIPQFDGKEIVAITGGLHHSLGLAADGTVYSWGRCHYGRLGQGKGTGDDGKWVDADDRLVPTPIAALNPATIGSPVVALGAGESHSLAVTKAGALYSWGFNELAQLGLGHDTETTSPAKCNGQQLTGGVALRNVLAASAGSQHSIVLARKVKGAAAAAPAAAAPAAASGSGSATAAAAAKP